MIEGRRVARFVFDTLKADTGPGGVNTLLGGRIYSRLAPQGVALPAAVVQLVSATPSNTLGGDRVWKNTLVDVRLVGLGSESIGPLVPIADRVDLVLQGAHGIEDGVYLYKLRAEDERELDETEGGLAYIHQIQTYRTEAYALAS